MSVPILLHPSDNVLVLAAPVRRGDVLSIDDHLVTASADVEVGHKLARHSLVIGEKVFKYGAPIGSMTAPAHRGEHVHLHNMKSDYIASHTRRAVGADEV
jgi:hypothetical protein